MKISFALKGSVERLKSLRIKVCAALATARPANGALKKYGLVLLD